MCTALPCVSANTWNSTWRGRTTYLQPHTQGHTQGRAWGTGGDTDTQRGRGAALFNQDDAVGEGGHGLAPARLQGLRELRSTAGDAHALHTHTHTHTAGQALTREEEGGGGSEAQSPTLPPPPFTALIITGNLGARTHACTHKGGTHVCRHGDARNEAGGGEGG